MAPMRTLAFVSTLLSTLVLTAGCEGPVLFAEVEIEELCDVRQDVAFSLSGPPVPLAYTEDLDFQLPEEIPADATEAEVQVVRVRVRTPPGGGDLSFVEEAVIWLRPSPEAADIEALRYQRAANGDPHDVTTGAGARFDLLPFIRQRKVLARVELAGTIPSQAFSAEVETCLYLRARYAR
jgi:hypothetical protein